MSPLDYELSQPTALLLKLWRDGTEQMQRNEAQTGDGGDPPQISAVIDLVKTLDDAETGLVIIDLMVLLDLMEQAIGHMVAERHEKSAE